MLVLEACFIHLERLKPVFPFKHMLSGKTKAMKLHVTDCSKNKSSQTIDKQGKEQHSPGHKTIAGFHPSAP